MKKLKGIITGVCCLTLSLSARSQTKTGADYFEGKWNVLVKATPNGDRKMFVVLDKKDSVMTGSIQDSTGVEISRFSKVELKGDEVTVYFTARDYDVSLKLAKKDDDHVTGSAMGTYEAEGDRIKPGK